MSGTSFALPPMDEIQAKLKGRSDAELRAHLSECELLLRQKRIVTEHGTASDDFRAAIELDRWCLQIELDRRAAAAERAA